MKLVPPKDIGAGSMSWTIIFQELNGEVASVLAAGSHDELIAWDQAQKSFNRRVLAILPGNHQVVTKRNIS
tara:strand:+ start:1593 stop:1805 length:213 start_codon:yes stop_codon:yes gene_type:complete